MDIQATIKSPSPQTSTAGSAVKSTTLAGTASNDNSFAAILEGQPQAGRDDASSGGAVDDRTTSILESLQLLQTILVPLLENQPVQVDGSGGQENTMSPISGLALQNQPFQLVGTGGRENTVSGSPAIPAVTLLQPLDRNSGLAVQTVQDTKLHTVTEPPNVNSTLLPLLDELTKAIEPKKPISAPRPLTEADTIPMQNIIVQGGQEDRLQQTKFRLDMLAVKNTGLAVTLQEQLYGGNPPDNSESHSSAEDSSQLPASPFPLQDLLKTLGQAEQLSTALPQGTVNAQSFVSEMSQFMTNNMKFSLGDVMKEATLSLHPEQLGHVDVKITLHEGGQLVAQFAADTTAGRQLLESQLPQLRQALQSQGLQVERLEVAQEQAGAASMFQQSRQQSNGGQPFERQPRQRITKLEANEGEFANGLRTIAEQRHELEEPAETSFDATA